MSNTHSWPAGPPVRPARSAPPKWPWGAFAVASALFLLTWALCWFNANVVNEDLQNYCADLHTQSFPPEKTCVTGNGTVTGANAGWVTAAFFTSATLSGASLAGALTLQFAARVGYSSGR
ncbi:hypothetical protein ABZ840_22635 [Streptomyces sp. NPDC047117]|uniref:hypothetical protein n=1 Tax=Streptomyces sp. NPDC047117 TaxID=3155379 RepID=UPI0033DEE6F8